MKVRIIIMIMLLSVAAYGQNVLFGGGWKANILPDSNSAFSDTTSVGDWLAVNGILTAENDSTLSFQDTTGNGYAYLPLTGIKKNKYRVQFEYKNVLNTDKVYYSFVGMTDSTGTAQNSWQTEAVVFKNDEDRKYYEFDGTDDYINRALTLTGDKTIFCEFEYTGNGTLDKEIIVGEIYGRFRFYVESGKISGRVFDTGERVFQTNISAYGKHKVIMAVDESNTKTYVYVDGILDTVLANVPTIASNNFRAGFDNASGSDYYKGSIYEVKYYGRYLSGSEIDSLFNGYNVSNPTLLWVGSGVNTTQWTDESGNGNNGTIYGNIFIQPALKLRLNKQAKVKIDNVKIQEAK